MPLLLLRSATVSPTPLPLAPVGAGCGYTGFPSPAQDYTEKWSTVEEFFNINPNTTWLFHAEGHSMLDLGIGDGDLLIVESWAQPELGDICICEMEGEFMAKILDKVDGKPALVSANPAYKPIPIHKENGIKIFGVVTGSGRRYRR